VKLRSKAIYPLWTILYERMCALPMIRCVMAARLEPVSRCPFRLPRQFMRVHLLRDGIEYAVASVACGLSNKQPADDVAQEEQHQGPPHVSIGKQGVLELSGGPLCERPTLGICQYSNNPSRTVTLPAIGMEKRKVERW
jgi:hypothetical protein